MWEAIEQNKRRSWVLIGVMGLVLLLLGYLIGAAIFYEAPAILRVADGLQKLERFPEAVANEDLRLDETGPFAWLENPSLLVNQGGLIGMLVAGVIWAGMTLFAMFEGDATLLRSARAHEIGKLDAPRLWNVVEEMSIASGLPTMPRVFIVDDSSPNAFAVGRKPEKAAVAVTSGLLKRMNRDELQGVVAHEIAHIHNLDIRFMTLASVMVGSVVIISEVFLRSLWYGSGRRSSSSKGGGAQAALMIVAILFAVLAPILAQLLYLACSRRREYLADASGAKFSRYPEGLASALEKIGAHGQNPDVSASRALAPLYIVNPLQLSSAAGLFSTHPPLEERITILRSMAGGAGYVDYEAAYESVVGGGAHCLNPEFLRNETKLRAREPSEEPDTKEDAIGRAREALDVIDRAANYLFLPCPCGLRMKLPPEMKRDSVECPRCGLTSEVPKARPGGKREVADTAGPAYHRQGQDWESFQCECGANIQLSPSFTAKRVSCRECGRHVRVVSGPSTGADPAAAAPREQSDT